MAEAQGQRAAAANAAAPTIEPMHPRSKRRDSGRPRPSRRRADAPDDAIGAGLPIVVARPSRRRRRRRALAAVDARLRRRDAPLAAAIAGALRSAPLRPRAGLRRDCVAAASAGGRRRSRALQDSVARLGSELATLKAGVDTAQRSTTAQFGKLAERLDRAEKAQAEPAAKLAKLPESIDRLEQPPAPACRSGAARRADITGSVAGRRSRRPQPPLAEGWRLRDFYAGRAVVESRNGTLFEVGPGSNLPGLGRVETIKREDGRWWW